MAGDTLGLLEGGLHFGNRGRVLFALITSFALIPALVALVLALFAALPLTLRVAFTGSMSSFGLHHQRLVHVECPRARRPKVEWVRPWLC